MSLLAVLAFLLATAVLAQAATTKVHSTTLSSMYVERLEIPSTFFVAGTITEEAKASMYAQGIYENPVAMSETTSPPLAGSVSTAIANTALVNGHWTYTVFLEETSPNKGALGNYSVSLEVGGIDRGTVYLVKVRHVDAILGPLVGKSPLPGVDDTAVPVGARVIFDLGADRPAVPTFILRVSYLDLPSYQFKSSQDVNTGKFYWIGVGGDIDGVTNPALTGHVGSGMRFIAVQGDGQAPHNFAIWDAAGQTVAGPTADIKNLGDEQTLVWTPTAAGTYHYVCVYHVPSQEGTIVVTG